MSLDDEEKLRHMRDYLFKVSRVKTRSNRPSSKDEYENMGKEEVLLKNLGVTPMTVFLPDLSHKIHNAKTSVQKTTIKAKPIRSYSREDLCKLNQMANQPHVKALAQDNHKTVPVPINTTGGSVEVPKASPSDYSFGTSLPKSLERPKSKIIHRHSFMWYLHTQRYHLDHGRDQK
jgi:phosphoinositide-3-kinase regulatory subunit 4